MRTGVRALLLALLAFLVGSAAFVPAASARASTSLGPKGTNHARPAQGHPVASSSLSRYVYEGTGWRAAGVTAASATFDLLRNPGAEPRLVCSLLSDYDALHLLRETLAGVATKPGASTAADIESTMQGLPKGKSGAVRVVATDAELQSTFDAMSKGGKPITRPGYNGPVVELPDGTQIGLRGGSKSGGRTIDVKYPSGTDGKVHIG